MRRTTLGTILLWLGAGAATAEPPEALAIVAGKPITAGEVDEAMAGELRELRQREASLRSQALDALISQRVVEAEAARRGLTLDALMKAEVEDKAALGGPELESHYEGAKAQFPGRTKDQVLSQIEPRLRQQRQQERQVAFLRELRAAAGVKVLLEPLRVVVEAGDAPSRGAKDAAVTILEFSDFECSFCARARPTLARLREVYAGKVRHVFRDFPLQMHPHAGKAAEAADCAGEQGRFWEMHDRLFAHADALEVDDLKKHAAAIGVEAAPFSACLDSGRHEAAWRKDAAEGVRLGVSGTPAFFINGRPLVGAQPFESFAQVIDDELERIASAAADKARAPIQ
jgi:protein-disulfide isomerase